MPKLVIETGEKKGLSYRLVSDAVSIGRDPSNLLMLPDRRVSRVHGRIIQKGEEYVVEDLGSVNGIWVNKKKIDRQTLKLGDEITFGTTKMKFLSIDASHATVFENADDSQVSIVEDKTPSQANVTLSVKPDSLMAAAESKDPQKANDRLSTLIKISHELATITSLSDLLNKFMDIVMDLMKADRGFIMLVDRETGELGDLQGVKRRKGLEKDEISISKTVINHVVETSESILSSDASQDDRFKEAESIILHDTRSTMCVPIKLKEKLLGIISVDTKGKVISFTQDDLELLTAISQQAAVAIENAKLFEDVKAANQELKDQQAQLIEAEKLSAVGQLASGVAHEINNPMTTILGYSELSHRRLSKEGLTKEEIKECAEDMKIVESEAMRCQRIVQSLLSFSRRKKEEMEETNINEVVEAAFAISKFHLKQKGSIKIEQNLDEKIPKVSANGNQLQQVFLNMIINARDAIGEKGTVTITTRKHDDQWVEISFSDTGCGIPEDKMEDIFKPLFTTKEEGKGTGLGLSITQDIVEQHKGTIDVESKVGEGTTFIIRLPITG